MKNDWEMLFMLFVYKKKRKNLFTPKPNDRSVWIPKLERVCHLGVADLRNQQTKVVDDNLHIKE